LGNYSELSYELNQDIGWRIFGLYLISFIYRVFTFRKLSRQMNKLFREINEVKKKLEKLEKKPVKKP
jgi:uncharacterized coiled-coil DUF342 family protein